MMFWGLSAAATRLMPPLTADIVRLRRANDLLVRALRPFLRVSAQRPWTFKDVRTVADTLSVARRSTAGVVQLWPASQGHRANIT